MDETNTVLSRLDYVVMASMVIFPVLIYATLIDFRFKKLGLVLNVSNTLTTHCMHTVFRNKLLGLQNGGRLVMSFEDCLLMATSTT